MIDHVLGKPSPSWRRAQVIGLILFLIASLRKGPVHGPTARISRLSTTLQRYSPWQLIAATFTAVYAFRHMDIILGLASPEPLSKLYSRDYYRATWINTALDAGFCTAYRIRPIFLRDILSVLFGLYYILFASEADEKLRRYRAVCTVELLRATWEKTTNPYLRLFTILDRPRVGIKRKLAIKRPKGSKYEREITVWVYFDGTEAAFRTWKGEIVMDCPGGGFISMTPRHHEERLLAWTKKIGRPVVAIDYGKAPEYPYPFAIHECLDLYKLLHSTRGSVIGIASDEPMRVVVSGDSAGANLACAMTIKLIERPSPLYPLPIALIFAYPALDFNFTSFMTPDHLRILRSLSSAGPGQELASGIRAQKDHMAHHSPLAVTDDQGLGDGQHGQNGDARTGAEEDGNWTGRARRSWKRSFSKLPTWMRDAERDRRERARKANEEMGIVQQPPTPGSGGSGGRRSSLKLPTPDVESMTPLQKDGKVLPGHLVAPPKEYQSSGLPGFQVDSPSRTTPGEHSAAEGTPSSSPKIGFGRVSLSRTNSNKRSLSERVIYWAGDEAETDEEHGRGAGSSTGPNTRAASTVTLANAGTGAGTGVKEAGIGTRLTMTSRTGYFNDRIISPTMMRCMAICYVGPRSSPDLSKNYYISPLLAPEHLLARFPPVFAICGSQDPFVDDTILFAARIREAKTKARNARREARSARQQAAADRLEASKRGGGRMGMTPTEPPAALGGAADSEVEDDVEEDADGDVATRIIEGWSHGFLQMVSLLPGVRQTFDLMAEEITAAFERDRTMELARLERTRRRDRELAREKEKVKTKERMNRTLSDTSDSEGDVLSFTPRRPKEPPSNGSRPTTPIPKSPRSHARKISGSSPRERRSSLPLSDDRSLLKPPSDQPAHAHRVSQLLSEQSAVRGRPLAASAPGSTIPSRAGSHARLSSQDATLRPGAVPAAPFVDANDLLRRRQEEGVMGTDMQEGIAEDGKRKSKSGSGSANSGAKGAKKENSREEVDKEIEEALIRDVPQNYGL